MLLDFTVSTDFASKPKRLGSWHLSAGGTALVVNFRDGGASGTIKFQVQLAINTSASQAYPHPYLPTFSSSLYVEVVSGTLNKGCVDLV